MTELSLQKMRFFKKKEDITKQSYNKLNGVVVFSRYHKKIKKELNKKPYSNLSKICKAHNIVSTK